MSKRSIVVTLAAFMFAACLSGSAWAAKPWQNIKWDSPKRGRRATVGR